MTTTGVDGHRTNTTAASESPVRSVYADDPDFAELLVAFTGALPVRRHAMEECLREGDLEGLKRQAHQMKGSAAGYGFPELSALAAELDAACREGNLVTAATRLADLLAYTSRIVRTT